MRLPFTKMHGLGNDFVVLDQVTRPTFLSGKQIRALADRHRGIGFDQLIYVEAPKRPDADFHYRVFNADGREIEHCGNGARCFYRFVRDKQLTWKRRLVVTTESGQLLQMFHVGPGLVGVEMEEPAFATSLIPRTLERTQPLYPLPVLDDVLEVGLVSVGNPHCVVMVPDAGNAPVADLGPVICSHSWFPKQANVSFMEIQSSNRIRLRVFERGVGETEACGTAACAAMAVGRSLGWLDEKVRVWQPGGFLQLSWSGPGQRMTMIGPAVSVFDGEIEL
jgi:diaminopimelate epimerase